MLFCPECIKRKTTEVMESDMPDISKAITYATDHNEQALENFKDLLKIPSISTLPEHEDDIKRAANWIAEQLRSLWFESVSILPTNRHPVVYGELKTAGPEAPTILFYGHYDVQPVDPLDEWESDPFDPQVRGENIYARGASDMKGQIVAHLEAMRAILETGEMPINIKYMIEGEEEIGSPSLKAFMQAEQERLTCDFCLNADSGILAEDQPALTVALRGLAYFELRLQGQRADLHSGMFGGAVDNPGMVLSKLLAGMKDDQGRIMLPGFYDDVRPLTEKERALMPELSDEWWLERAGAKKLLTESGYKATESARARPTLDVNGILCGFTGEGSKTVLPARAMGKFSMRLVPNQTPEKTRASLEAYLEEHMPETMTYELIEHAGSPPAMIDPESPALEAAAGALQEVWGKQVVYDRQGGTVPVVALIQELLGVDSLMLGFGLPSDNIHGPNEKQHLPTFYRGIETFIHFMFAIRK
jgi:acetylornithine deacetylase/succinyl-diaminopimelate desuccinylase-like protein